MQHDLNAGKYKEVNRRHLEMRSHLCMNRDRDFFSINRAALISDNNVSEASEADT